VRALGFVEVLRIKHHEADQDQEYCEREVDEVEWQAGRIYLHLGVRRDDPQRR
jgi:hypothetical protein